MMMRMFMAFSVLVPLKLVNVSEKHGLHLQDRTGEAGKWRDLYRVRVAATTINSAFWPWSGLLGFVSFNDYFPKHHQPTDLCNGDALRFLRGMD